MPTRLNKNNQIRTSFERSLMSGRKDYSYTLTALRRAAEQAARAARVVQRAEAQRQREEQMRVLQEAAKQKAAEVKQRLADARRRTQDHVDNVASVRTQQLAEVQAIQQQKNADKLADAAARTHSDLESANRTATSNASNDLREIADELGLSESTIHELSSDQRPEEAHTRIFDACVERQQLNNEVQNSTANLKSWLDTLSRSDDVKHFGTHRLQTWQETTATLLNTKVETVNVRERLHAVQQAILEAEQIEVAAIDTAEKFQQRNSVLKDILESLQEVGFFVQDPEYLDPMRPDQAVVIRANRADQTMVAKVSLDASVESNWQGIHGEYCTDAFFAYVKQMNRRGVEITSDNPQLAPMLKQQDALNLPTINERRSGNE
jgi:hypothetical protein